MSKVQTLRDLVTRRQSAAAEEILELFQRTRAESRDLCYSTEEVHRHKLMAEELTASAFSLGLEVHHLIFSEQVPCEQQEWSLSVNNEDPKLPHIKEEQEEFRCGHEGEQLQRPEEADINKFPFTAVTVKSEDEVENARSSQLQQRQKDQQMKKEADEDCGRPEPARRLRVLVKQRLTAAVEEIFGMFETMLAEYKEEIQGLHKLLEGSVKSDDEVNKADDPELLAVEEVGSSEQRSSLDQEEPEPPRIKEEQEEEQLQGPEEDDITKFPFTAVSVKSEDEEEKAPSSLLHQTQTDQQMKREADEDCGGSEPARIFGPAFDLQKESNETHNDGSVGCDVSNPVEETVIGIQNLGVDIVGKPFNCSICAKGFSQKSDLKRHLRFHTGERPYSCVFCEKHFTEKADLKRHVRVHTGEKPFSCSLCGKIFSQNENLRRHAKIHTGEKPFCCPVCSKKFTHRGALVIHMRIHTGEKPFGCSLCVKRYSEAGNLKKHMQVHAAQKPFSCGVCGRRFNYHSQVKNHKCSGESGVTTAHHS